MDLTTLKNSRLAEIRPMKDKGLENIEVFKIARKRNGEMAGKMDKIDDLLNYDDQELLL
jgi:hypothetical protein